MVSPSAITTHNRRSTGNEIFVSGRLMGSGSMPLRTADMNWFNSLLLSYLLSLAPSLSPSLLLSVPSISFFLSSSLHLSFIDILNTRAYVYYCIHRYQLHLITVLILLQESWLQHYIFVRYLRN